MAQSHTSEQNFTATDRLVVMIAVTLTAPPVHELVRVYEKNNKHEKCMLWLDKAVYQKGARGEWATTLGEEHLKKGDFPNAARAFLHALEMGRDSAKISQLILTHPELAPFMRR